MQISEYWSRLNHSARGWIHPDDEPYLSRIKTSFNFDYPPPAFVGDVTRARVIILVANGGYDPVVTKSEFSRKGAEAEYIRRLSAPSQADWGEVAPYYNAANYSRYLYSRSAAVVNVCAYRSKKISEEPENKLAIKNLPSAKFQREWLVTQILPAANAGERIIVGKRHGMWELPEAVKQSSGYIADPAPVSPHLSRVVLEHIARYV